MNAPRFPHASVATATKVSGVIVEQTDRAADIATIVDHHGHGPTDEMLLERVRRQLKWSMLSDEALAMLADEYRRHEAFREKLNAENRAIAAGRGR